MKIKHRHFPYPILTPFNDDIKGKFDATIEAEMVDSEMQFQVQFTLENPSLEQLIMNGQATYAIHLECGSTMKRFFEKSFEQKHTFTIDQKYLNNLVEINFFVIANADISNYLNTDFHEDFEGGIFNIQKGDQLALTETVKMNITKEPIAQTSSIFELTINPLDNAPYIAVDFQEKIVISVPKATYEKINEMRVFIGEDVDNLFITMFYVPALMEALTYVKESIEGDELHFIESYTWYRSIANRLQRMGKNIELLHQEENIPNLAIQILDNINEKAFDSISRIFGVVEEVGDLEL